MSLQDKRRRQHEEPHERTIERQILDALLRIEELLIGDSVRVEGDVADLITQITPTKTPFLEAGAGGLIGGTSGLVEEDDEKPMAKKARGREPTGPRMEDRGSQGAASV
jgi:hypothetical protein